ncbi:hypothetical protein PBY51_023886 [Eleginops maclovinus]|uniref:Uncharacterized protein n=1 Tax=Eleginops maclovinus TaxID=56733 RepID=A0AAN8AEU7_ELEMC|nr:hypothetical protein PBY51_023886 [Eleginops maclovinus]
MLPIKVSPESGTSCLRLVCTALTLHNTVLSFSHCLVLRWPPRNGDHHTLISHFTGVNSPFSTASAGGAPFTSSSPMAPPLACVQPGVVYWTAHLEGLAFHQGSCWHHVPLPSGGWSTARTPLLHTPSSISP